MKFSRVEQSILGVLSPGFGGIFLPDHIKQMLDHGLGGITLFGSNTPDPQTTARLSEEIHKINPECIVSIDEESGDVSRIWATTGSNFPTPYFLGRLNNPEITRSVFQNLGGQLRELGIDLTFAPVADLSLENKNPIVGVRSFGAEVFTVSNHVEQAVLGLQESGVAACVKHFPGHGRTTQDSHHQLPKLSADLEKVLESDIVPFRRAIECGVSSVMLGHLVLEEVDVNPASISTIWNQEILRNQFGFEGVSITDALDMGALGGIPSIDQSALKAVTAGADLLCLSGLPDQKEFLHRILRNISQNYSEQIQFNLETSHARLAKLRQTPKTEVIAQIDLGKLSEALEVNGNIPKLNGTFGLVTLAAEPTVAAGKTAWGIRELLIKKGQREVNFETAETKIVQFRDLWRSPEDMEIAQKIAGMHPEAVFIDFGWPSIEFNPPKMIRTFGATRIQAELVTSLLCLQ